MSERRGGGTASSAGTAGGGRTARAGNAASIARVGLCLFGGAWLVLGSAIALGAVGIGIADPTSRAVVGGLLAVDGGLFFAAGRLYGRRGRGVDVAVVGLVIVNLALTFTDDVGLIDLAAAVALLTLAVVVFVGMSGSVPSGS